MKDQSLLTSRALHNPCPMSSNGSCVASQSVVSNSLQPGSSVHGIFQARILEWVAMPSSRGIFWTQGLNPHLMSLALAGGFFTTSPTGEARGVMVEMTKWQGSWKSVRIHYVHKEFIAFKYWFFCQFRKVNFHQILYSFIIYLLLVITSPYANQMFFFVFCFFAWIQVLESLLLLLPLWASGLTSLRFSFLLCNMEFIGLTLTCWYSDFEA